MDASVRSSRCAVMNGFFSAAVACGLRLALLEAVSKVVRRANGRHT